MLTALLLILAAICFGLAAFNVVVRGANLVALGLLFWIAVPLIAALN